MKYYESEFHEKLVRTDAQADQAFAKPITGGDEVELPKGSPILIDALSTPISEEEYNNPKAEKEGAETTEDDQLTVGNRCDIIRV